jgi:hypothetical protein
MHGKPQGLTNWSKYKKAHRVESYSFGEEDAMADGL